MKKTAIVTGSSRGIGFAIAKQLGLDGYNIVMVATGPQEKNQHALDELKAMGIRAYGKQVEAQLADFAQTVKAGSRTELAMVYRLRDMLLSQHAYLTAMADYTAHGGQSRGSALYTDLTGGVKPFAQLPDTFTFALDETEAPLIQELWFEDGTCRTGWRAPRPIPEDDDFFENVWRSYRETENID